VTLGPTLGRGACGLVFKGQFRGRTAAIKRLHKELLQSEGLLEAFVKEIELMAKLNHKNILQFLGACLEYPNISFVTVFMDRGTVNDVIKAPGGCAWEIKVKMARGAAEGLKFLHELTPPIVHRDLKSHNLLVDNDYNVVIGDFGVSEALESEDKRFASRWGTVNWMPPEVFDGGVYDCKSDIFSFGMVLWEMLTGQIPFGDDTNPLMVHQLVDGGERPFIPASCHPEFARLIRACWEGDPDKRPYLDAILKSLELCLLPAPEDASMSDTTAAVVLPAATATASLSSYCASEPPISASVTATSSSASLSSISSANTSSIAVCTTNSSTSVAPQAPST